MTWLKREMPKNIPEIRTGSHESRWARVFSGLNSTLAHLVLIRSLTWRFEKKFKKSLENR